MASPLQEPRAGELGARLRALRRAHPTLAVLTEIVQLDERRVAFRATVHIDGEPRAQGHAARGADPAGEFVAAAERLAVEQALLLGGFSTTGDEAPLADESEVGLPPVLSGAPAPPEGGTSASADSPVAPAPRRRRVDRIAQVSATSSGAGDTGSHGLVVAPEVAGAATADASVPAGTDGDLAASGWPSPSPAATDAAMPDRPSGSASPLSPVATPAAVAAVTSADPSGAAGDPVELSPAPRRQRDRRAERERARARETATVPGVSAEMGTNPASGADMIAPGAAAGPPAPVGTQQPAPVRSPLPAEEAISPATHGTTADGVSSVTSPGASGPPLATAPRRGSARRTVADRQVAPAPEELVAREAVRAAWQVGRPIPAWWPPDRRVVERPLSKSQGERLRAVARDEEMTAAQLDRYSALLFGRAVAELSQAQGAILEERLNPAYPSPLQELSARRVIHPIAVGDTVAIPDGQQHLIRWRDVPPAEELPPSPEQVSPSWRAGGAKRGGNRRRR